MYLTDGQTNSYMDITRNTGREKMTASILLEKEPVRGLIYYSVMAGNSTGMTYLIYLYTNGMV